MAILYHHHYYFVLTKRQKVFSFWNLLVQHIVLIWRVDSKGQTVVYMCKGGVAQLKVLTSSPPVVRVVCWYDPLWIRAGGGIRSNGQQERRLEDHRMENCRAPVRVGGWWPLQSEQGFHQVWQSPATLNNQLWQSSISPALEFLPILSSPTEPGMPDSGWLMMSADELRDHGDWRQDWQRGSP